MIISSDQLLHWVFKVIDPAKFKLRINNIKIIDAVFLLYCILFSISLFLSLYRLGKFSNVSNDVERLTVIAGFFLLYLAIRRRASKGFFYAFSILATYQLLFVDFEFGEAAFHGTESYRRWHRALAYWSEVAFSISALCLVLVVVLLWANRGLIRKRQSTSSDHE